MLPPGAVELGIGTGAIGWHGTDLTAIGLRESYGALGWAVADGLPPAYRAWQEASWRLRPTFLGQLVAASLGSQEATEGSSHE